MHHYAALEMAVAADERVRVNHATLAKTGAFLDVRDRVNARRGHHGHSDPKRRDPMRILTMNFPKAAYSLRRRLS
jgi:hypothetical protein